MNTRKRRGRTLLAAGGLAGTLVTLAPACGTVVPVIYPAHTLTDGGTTGPPCEGAVNPDAGCAIPEDAG